MLDKFWESVGENLAGEWLKRVFNPAFLFLMGGLGLYFLKNGWQSTWNWLTGLQVVEQAALLFVILLLLILSSLIMERLRFSFLRLLEGYWPSPLGWLATSIEKLQIRQLQRCEHRWNELKSRETLLTPNEKRELAYLELNTHYFPANLQDVLPTTLGNILRGAETAPKDKYGLDAFVCWPRLWLLLPTNTREELSAMRQVLMGQVELWVWGLLFLVWVTFSPWALLISALWMWLAQTSLLQAGMAYADLLEAAFDLYRWELYKFARWPLPETTGDLEIQVGQRLTEFLWRGEATPPIRYQVE